MSREQYYASNEDSTNENGDRGEFVVHRLEAKYWLDNTNGNQAVHQVEEREQDNDETCCLEEDPCILAVLDTEGAKAHETEYGKRTESEGTHRESATEETACSESVNLHRLGEPARQEERGDANEEWCERVIEL